MWKPEDVDGRGKQWTNNEKDLLFESMLGPDSGKIYNYVIKNNKEGFKLVSTLYFHPYALIFIRLWISISVGKNL